MNKDSKKNESKYLNRQYYQLEKQLKSTNQNTQFIPGGVSLRNTPVVINNNNSKIFKFYKTKITREIYNYVFKKDIAKRRPFIFIAKN